MLKATVAQQARKALVAGKAIRDCKARRVQVEVVLQVHKVLVVLRVLR